jgi:hypothetical protein
LSLCPRLGHAPTETSLGSITLGMFISMWIGLAAGFRHGVSHAAQRGKIWRTASTYAIVATWTGKGLPRGIIV